MADFTDRVDLRVSPAQRKALEAGAKRHGLGLANFARMALALGVEQLAHADPAAVELTDEQRELVLAARSQRKP